MVNLLNYFQSCRNFGLVLQNDTRDQNLQLLSSLERDVFLVTLESC